MSTGVITAERKLFSEIKEMNGIRGIHIMAIEWEEVVPQLVEKAGLALRTAVEERYKNAPEISYKNRAGTQPLSGDYAIRRHRLG